MSSIEDFRDISDEIMKDIEVGTALKHKTLIRCRKNSLKPVLGILTAAACVVLIVAAVNTVGWQGRTKDNSKITVMMEQSSGMENAPARSSTSGVLQAPQESDAYSPAVPEEAKKAYGDGLLLPEYVPEDFKLASVNISKDNTQNVNKITLTYTGGQGSFEIKEEKNKPETGFQGYKTLKINGISGYVKSNSREDESRYTEVYWSDNGITYSVTGGITEKEAIKLAESMK